MRNALIAVCLIPLLAACGSTRVPADAVVIDQLSRELRSGSARAYDRFAWLPGSQGFTFSRAGMRTGGQLLLREDSMLWGRYESGAGWFRVAREIPLKRISTVSLAQRDAQYLIVVEAVDGSVDTFGVPKPAARRDDGPQFESQPTADVYRMLLSRLGL